MLKSFYIKNYKAFNSKTIIDISNINILLGKNSVGKSSILEILLLILQTIESDNIDINKINPLLLNGKLVKLGNNKDFVYSNNTSRATKLQLGFILDGQEFQNFILYIYKFFKRSLGSYLIDFIKYIKDEYKGDYKKQLKIITEFKDLNLENIDSFTRALSYLISKFDENFDKNKNNSYDRMEVEGLKSIISISKILKKFLLIVPNNRKIKAQNIEISIDFLINRTKFSIKKYSFIYGKSNIFNISKRNNDYKFIGDNLLQDLNIDFNKIFPELKYDKKSNINFGFYRRFIDKNLIYTQIFKIINSEFNKVFNKNNIFHITPLRANPKRHYLVDEFYNFSSDLGESLVQELEKKDVIDFVNKWFQEFGLKIVTDGKNNSVLKSLKVQQYGGNRDIVDVGFGISQILPIIVQSMIAPKGSIVLIEQPEIHLHPSMQSKLADLFIDIVKERNLKLVIETHSEYFLNRLKLRLAQTNNNTEGNDYKITNDKINIYFFSENKAGNGTKVDNVKIHKFGKIDFPKGFKDYDDNFAYMQEILKLNLD